MRIPCQSAHAGVRLALRVVVEVDEFLVVLVHRQPCRIVVLLAHLALHRGNDAQSAARDGGVADAGVLVSMDKLNGQSHLVGRHMVEVGHEGACVGPDIFLAPASLEHSLAHDTRARLLDASHECFVRLGCCPPVHLRFLAEVVTTDGCHHRLP